MSGAVVTVAATAVVVVSPAVDSAEESSVAGAVAALAVVFAA